MTPSELKFFTQETNPHFFSRSTMKFFGDTMRNYGVRGVVISTDDEKNVFCFELYRKKPVAHGLQNSHYFRRDNFKTISPKGYK